MKIQKKNSSDGGLVKTQFECKRDGLILRGTEYRPAGGNLPAAIVCHGFMANQDTVRQYAKALARMGYVSYCFDFSGGSVIKGKSEGRTTDMSVLTEVKDLEAVMDYVLTRPYCSGYLLVMGCSQGGFVAALAASRWKTRISKLVLFYPAFCIPDDARAGRMMFARFDPEQIPEVIPCGPMKLGRRYAEDVIRMDPFKEIKEYPGDVLIVHGTDDTIVSMNYISTAYETYSDKTAEAGRTRTVRLKIIESGKHGFSGKHDKIAIDALREFCADVQTRE